VLSAGAKGYLSKRCAPQELIQAIRKVHNGETFVANQVLREMSKTPGADENAIGRLTAREFQVFSMLAEGRTAVEIGQDMNLSHKTIHSHRANMMKKLGLDTSISIVQFAKLQGIIQD
jgi:DNA-binding NarL/FixJ family response regulator